MIKVKTNRTERIVYFCPLVTILFITMKRLRKPLLEKSQLRFPLMLWLVSVALILIGEMTASSLLVMGATGAFVLLTLGLSATITAREIIKRI